MSPTTNRRILLVALVAVSLVAVLSGCAGEPIHGYLWAFDPTLPVCTTVLWRQIRPEQAPGLCMERGHAATRATSCAVGCMVLSPYSEQQAKQLDSWGESVYDHEMRHALQRMVHP